MGVEERNNDAIHISNGACNPVAVASAIHRHASEILAEGNGMDPIRDDPAMRLMVHQLAFLMKTSELEDLSVYRELREHCQINQ